jgi:hypothetical protein
MNGVSATSAAPAGLSSSHAKTPTSKAAKRIVRQFFRVFTVANYTKRLRKKKIIFRKSLEIACHARVAG